MDVRNRRWAGRRRDIAVRPHRRNQGWAMRWIAALGRVSCLQCSAAMLPTRWSALARYGLLGNTLLLQTAAADPCDDVAERSVSLVIGVELSPKARVIGGLEGRQCLSSKTEGVLRLEFGGGPRLLFGARARPFEDMAGDASRENVGLEAGLVLEQHSQIGAHLALSYGPHFAYT